MSKTHLTEDQIQRMIASDPDAPEATAAQLAQARPFTEAFPVLSDAMRRNIGTLVRFGVITDIPPHLIELARRLEEALRAAALRREKQMADAAHRRPS